MDPLQATIIRQAIEISLLRNALDQATAEIERLQNLAALPDDDAV